MASAYTCPINSRGEHLHRRELNPKNFRMSASSTQFTFLVAIPPSTSQKSKPYTNACLKKLPPSRPQIRFPPIEHPIVPDVDEGSRPEMCSAGSLASKR